MSKHLDDYQQTFPEFSEMLCFFEQQHAESQWETCKVSDIRIAPLTKGSPILDDTLSKFAPGVSREAVNDTIANLGLAAKISGVAGGKYFPVRNTAYKSLTGRASIQGTTLNRLPREKLASVLNHCFCVPAVCSAGLYDIFAIFSYRKENGKNPVLHTWMCARSIVRFHTGGLETRMKSGFSGAPEKIRTPGLLIRSHRAVVQTVLLQKKSTHFATITCT